MHTLGLFCYNLLCNFQFYRRRMGGTWYKVGDPAMATGMCEEMYLWMQRVPEGWEVLKTESY
jgi:hypothetical protein